MAAAKSKRKTKVKSKRQFNVADKLKNIVFSSQGFPIILTLFTIATMFVLFRMKGVDMRYKVAEEQKTIDKLVMENKELKARKAKLLSVTKLKKLAKKYELNQPKQSQIIVLQ